MMLQGIILDRGSQVSLRRQLVGHLETRILGGQIAPGRRLPSVRRVEELLGLHRNTVAAAYRELVQAGLARTRPGSGVYARSPSHRIGGCGSITALGPRDVRLLCPDPALEDVLREEIQSRLAVAVRRSEVYGPSVPVHLAPSVAFLRLISEMPRPSVISVVSGSERVHRLVASAVLVHVGEGVACLPVDSGDVDGLARAHRLGAFLFADYASMNWTRYHLKTAVSALPLISSLTSTQLALLLRRYGPGSDRFTAHCRRRERSRQPSVQEP
jgi:hypothetical protein